MGYAKEIYLQALQQVEQRRIAAENAAADRKADAYRLLPELNEIDDLIRKAGIAATREALKLSGTDGIVKLKETYDRLAERKARMLAGIGVSEDDFKPKYTCSECDDTGYAGGKLCRCAKHLARQIAYAELCSEMPLADCTFDRFSLSYYSGQDRERMKRIFDRCVEYATDFEAGAANMLFMGRTGLGKTHLSLAIAGTVTGRGYGVIYGSAQNLLSRIEREHFSGKGDDTLNSLLECDLLILDDLGAEFSTAFTTAAIYNIINSRILTGRPTVISTNLSADELNDRYGERVMSRMIGNFEKYMFLGNDVRQQKALAKK